MKRINKADMRTIANSIYPNDRFDVAMYKLVNDGDWKLVTPMVSNGHYSVMDKLLVHLK